MKSGLGCLAFWSNYISGDLYDNRQNRQRNILPFCVKRQHFLSKHMNHKIKETEANSN